MDNEKLISLLTESKIYRSDLTINNNYRKVLKTNIQLQSVIQEHTSFIIDDDISSFRERLFCIAHNITERQLCEYCNINPVRFTSERTYLRFCCTRCAQRSEQTRLKQKATVLVKYGVSHIFKSTHYLQKREQTCLEKYGVKHHWLNEQIQQKRIDTFERNYGVKNPRQKHLSYNVLDFLNNKDWLIQQHHNNKLSLIEISSILCVNPTTVGNYCRKHQIKILYHSTTSHEKEISTFLKTLNIRFKTNDRKLIYPYELDYLFAEQKVAIEYCGLFWHCDYHERIPKHYHKTKLQMCKQKGYRLVTIFEDEWLNRQEIVKDKLKNILGIKHNVTIYGRQTSVVSITTKQRTQFLNTYHIQGDGLGSISYGLTYSNELVACMTFIQQKGGCFILNRYATRCNIPGGFSKLLAFFKQQHVWEKIVSFADLRWSEGKLYSTTGFVLEDILLPDYAYVVQHQRIHKFNYRHKNLPKLLKVYNPALSEVQNCRLNGIFRIWNCGLMRYSVINNCTTVINNTAESSKYEYKPTHQCEGTLIN